MNDNKKRRRRRRGLFILEMIILILVGAGVGWFFSDSGFLILIGVIVLIAPIVGFFGWLKKRYAEAPCENPEEAAPPEPRTKRALRLILQLSLGASFGFGVVGLLMLLIGGQAGGYAVYIGSLALGVVLIILMLATSGVHDPELKAIKKEMKYYNNDERIQAISYKAGYKAFGLGMILMLLFGAAIAVLPIGNGNVIAAGFLAIFAVTAIIYIFLFNRYDADKGKGQSEKSCLRSSIIQFAISLLPLILIGLRWIFTEISGAGIAFFVAFALVSSFLLINVWYELKWVWERKRNKA